eukprot:g826.t1
MEGPVDLSANPVWKFQTSSSISSQVVIDKVGDMYFGSNDKGIYAVHPDGSSKWKIWTRRASVGSGALTNDGTLYFGNWDSEMYAINTTDGTVVWKSNVPAYVSSSPIIGSDGSIIFGCGDKSVHAISPFGLTLWEFKTHRPIISSPAMSPDARIVYIASQDGSVYALDAFSGRLLWNTTTTKGGDDKFVSSPILSNDGQILYIGGAGEKAGRVFALASDTGERLWSYETKRTIIGSPALDPYGGVVIASWDNHVYALHPDGSMRWKTNLEKIIESTPLVDAAGRVYVGTWGGHMYVLRGCDGVVLSSRFHAGGVSTAAVLHEQTGYLVYGAGDGAL